MTHKTMLPTNWNSRGIARNVWIEGWTYDYKINDENVILRRKKRPANPDGVNPLVLNNKAPEIEILGYMDEQETPYEVDYKGERKEHSSAELENFKLSAYQILYHQEPTSVILWGGELEGRYYLIWGWGKNDKLGSHMYLCYNPSTNTISSGCLETDLDFDFQHDDKTHALAILNNFGLDHAESVKNRKYAELVKLGFPLPEKKQITLSQYQPHRIVPVHQNGFTPKSHVETTAHSSETIHSLITNLAVEALIDKYMSPNLDKMLRFVYCKRDEQKRGMRLVENKMNYDSAEQLLQDIKDLGDGYHIYFFEGKLIGEILYNETWHGQPIVRRFGFWIEEVK